MRQGVNALLPPQLIDLEDIVETMAQSSRYARGYASLYTDAEPVFTARPFTDYASMCETCTNLGGAHGIQKIELYSVLTVKSGDDTLVVTEENDPLRPKETQVEALYVLDSAHRIWTQPQLLREYNLQIEDRKKNSAGRF